MVEIRKISTLVLIAAIFGVTACSTAPVAKVKTDYGEREARAAEVAMDDADRQMDALEVEAAEKDMEEARQAMADPDIDYYPERNVLRARLGKLEARLVRTKATKDRLQRETVMNRQQERVSDQMEKLEEAIAPLEGLQVTKEDIVRAKEAFHRTRQVLAKGRSFETRFPTYAKYAADCESTLAQKKAQINLAEGLVAFVNGPGARSEKAKEILKDVTTATTTTRPALYRQAMTNLESCRLSGKEMLASVEHLNTAKVWLGGQTTNPKAVTDWCDSRLAVVEKRMTEASQEAQRAQARRVPPAPAPASPSKSTPKAKKP